MPKDEPLAPNPPLGAMIDYSLPAGLAGPMRIAIYDAAGKLVSTFSSADPVKPIDLSTIAVAPEWVISPKPPLATPGHHRFVWDLHYAKPTGLKDDDALSRECGPRQAVTPSSSVSPATPCASLWTSSLIPRVKVSQADFEAEFRLAKRIEQARVRVRRMLEQAAELKTGLAKTQGSDPVAAELAQLFGDAAPISGATAPTTLTSISEWLDNLAQAVDGADGAPTPDNVKGFAIVSAALDQLEPRWTKFEMLARPRVTSTP